MKWFGPTPFSRLALDGEIPRVDVPITPCAWCEEAFHSGDSGYLIPFLGGPGAPAELAYHVECFQRQIIGSVAHIECACSCFGGSPDGDLDPPHLSKREAAQAAVVAYNALRGSRGI